MSVKEGSSYRVSAWVRTAHPKTVDVCMQFYSSNGGRVRSVRSTKYRLVANVWTLVSAVITAPVTAARAAPFIYEANSEQFGQGNIFDTMAWMCYEDKPGALALDYFDGATAPTTEYAYAWTGDPNASSSIRTALTDRSPDALTWQPGRSAWEFIQPIFQAVGLRLFCDEARRWWLVDAGHVHDGHVQLSAPGNLIRARDDISRSSDDWYDAALFEYRWMDSTATSQIAFDWYAEPGHTRVRHFLVEHAYPGAGAAEYAVKRAQGKGRALDLTAVTRYSVRPSQPVTASLPGTPIQSGLVARVTFDLGLNEMTLTTRGLTDTPADAYIFGDPSIRYLDVPPGMTYNTFDWSVL